MVVTDDAALATRSRRARGVEGQGFAGLVVVDAVEDFAAPIVELLGDDDLRCAREAPQPDRLARHSWDAAGDALRDYLRAIVAQRG